MEKKIEILAPAGDLESLKAAINAGANAVYLGLSGFNARAKAENFNENNIRSVVRYAHLYGVKIYVTLNTLVSDCEIEDMIKMVDVAYLAKVDAFIVQDLGVAKILKERYENIVLHASTQMGINNYYGAIVLKQLGFKRVVLSRETSLEDIKLIKEKTDLEIEYFVQGALCVGFSGNCYFSSLKKNKSGNRGECLQFCRLKYSTNISKNESYFLSPKDLCFLKNLKDLVESGVESLKIEGRLRRASYVFQSVRSYSKAVEFLSCNKDFLIDGEINKLKEIYIRGKDYNYKGYLYNDNSNIIDFNYNNSTGVEIGKVVSSKKFKDLFEIIIQSKVEINSGDGLKFYNDDLSSKSLGVGNVIKLNGNLYKIYSKINPKSGSKCFRILNYENENRLISYEKKLTLNLKIELKIGSTLKILASSCGVEIEYNDKDILEKSNKIIVSKESIIEQFSRLKSTNFNIGKIDVDMNDIFISKSKINSIRNEIVKLIEDKIIDEYEKNCVKKINKFNISRFGINELKNDFNVFLITKISELEDFKINKNDYIFLKPDNYLSESFLSELKWLSDNYNNFGINLPAFANHNDLIIFDNIINKFNNISILIDNIYGFNYKNNVKNVLCNYQMNLYNSISFNVVNGLGAIGAVRSCEYINGEINNKNYLNFDYGRINLMHFIHCPYKVVYGCECSNCAFDNKLKYNLNNSSFKVTRHKISKCYFYLKDDKKIDKIKKSGSFIDLT